MSVEYPSCRRCGEDLTYDIKARALDGEDLENGFHLSISVVCAGCGDRTMPTKRMQQDMLAIAERLTPEGAQVSPAYESSYPPEE